MHGFPKLKKSTPSPANQKGYFPPGNLTLTFPLSITDPGGEGGPTHSKKTLGGFSFCIQKTAIFFSIPAHWGGSHVPLCTIMLRTRSLWYCTHTSECLETYSTWMCSFLSRTIPYLICLLSKRFLSAHDLWPKAKRGRKNLRNRNLCCSLSVWRLPWGCPLVLQGLVATLFLTGVFMAWKHGWHE